jgi:hypothetical protein
MAAAELSLGAQTRLMQLAYIDRGGVHGEFRVEIQSTFSALTLLCIPSFVTIIPYPSIQASWAATRFPNVG